MKVGVLGAGQLGRMLGLAGIPLGLEFRFFDPAESPPAAAVGDHVRAEWNDQDALEQFSDGVDVVTLEFENVPVAALELLSQRLPVFPGSHALATAQDRLNEKTLFRQLGIPTPEFAPIDSFEDLAGAVERIGLPAVLKTRRLGYDGKGQSVLRAPGDLVPAWEALGAVPLILEAFVRFDREVSLLAVRGRAGELTFYPLVENVHRSGILHLSTAPASESEDLQPLAEAHAAAILDALDYVGVMALELFVQGELLLANEIAPRVHNSGHWTIEGAETSQFENHLRAVLGLPLGSTQLRGATAMLNLVGALPDSTAVLSVPGAHLHLYGKAPRPGRKVGHITVMDSAGALAERVSSLEVLLRNDLG